MADQTTAATIQPMQPGRFLELLNKSPRTEEEEAALQAELLRQQHEKTQLEEAQKAQDAQTTESPPAQEPSVPADQPVAPVQNEQPAEPVAPVQPEQLPAAPEVSAQPQQEPAPAEQIAPTAPVEHEAPVQPEAGYSLTQLSGEINDAIAYLKTIDQTLNIEMAISSLSQAKYFVELAAGN